MLYECNTAVWRCNSNRYGAASIVALKVLIETKRFVLKRVSFARLPVCNAAETLNKCWHCATAVQLYRPEQASFHASTVVMTVEYPSLTTSMLQSSVYSSHGAWAV
jgi:hypothetical protein